MATAAFVPPIFTWKNKWVQLKNKSMYATGRPGDVYIHNFLSPKEAPEVYKITLPSENHPAQFKKMFTDSTFYSQNFSSMKRVGKDIIGISGISDVGGMAFEIGNCDSSKHGDDCPIVRDSVGRIFTQFLVKNEFYILREGLWNKDGSALIEPVTKPIFKTYDDENLYRQFSEEWFAQKAKNPSLLHLNVLNVAGL